RVLQATGYVALTTAATALMSDLAPAARRASALAIFGVAANIAMTTVPAGVSLLLPLIALSGAFWLSGGLALLGGLLVSQIQEPALVSATNEPTHGRGLFTLAQQLRLPLLLAWLFGLGFGAFFQFLPLLTERRGLGSAGLLYTIYGLSIIGTRLLTGRWLDQWPPSRWLMLGFAFLSAGLALLASGQMFAWLALGVALIAFGSGVLHPLLITLHVQPVAAQERGRAGAVFYLGFDLGIGLGLWLLSPIIARFGLTGLFVTTAVVAFFAILPATQIQPSGEQLT
ncbi:MAG: MFS transporter, partial [Anaerolineales bacterium]|nr:MFS transporter [Anaerolineales bacterium]